MKQYLQTTLLLLLTLVIGGGKAVAQDETIDLTAQGYSNAQSLESITTNGGNCSISYAKNSNSTSPTYYTSGTAVRIYGSNSFTVSSESKKIAKLQITISSYDKTSASDISVSSGTLDTSTKPVSWTAKDDNGESSVTFTNTATKGHWRIQKVAVTYVNNDGKTGTDTKFTSVTGSSLTTVMYGEVSAAATVEAGGTTITDATVTYSSTNEKIATVEADGTVKTQSPGTAVIRADYAGNDTYASSYAEFTLTIKGECEDIMTMQNEIDKLADNGIESITADLTFTNATVTGVTGSNAYIYDGNRGMFVSGVSGLEKGNVINGKVENATLLLSKGSYAIKDFSTTGLTITSTELTPTETSIETLQTNGNNKNTIHIGKYVTIKNVTYDKANATFTDTSDKTIAYYDGLKTNPSLIDGNKYDVTGVVGYNNALQLMPTDVTALAKVATLKTETAPKTTLNTDNTDTYTLTYVGDGEVSVASSNTDAATAEYNADTKTVTVTPVAKGETTITISATAGTEYGIPEVITYTLEVNDASEMTETFNATDEDIKGKGHSGENTGGFIVDRDNIAIVTSDAYANSSNTYIQIYKNSTITITAKEGYLITGTELSVSNTTNYAGVWTCNGIETSISNNKVTWAGIVPSIIIQNTNSRQAYVYTIKVDYIKLTDTGKTVTITEAGKGTYCATANCVVGDGTVTKYITGTEENGTTLTETDAAVIAEGEGVLLNGKAGEYKVYTHSLLAPTKNESNKLVGCSEATSVPAGAYVMQNQTSGVAFYIVTDADPITCPAGKAYLKDMSSQSKALFFSDSETTGIDNIGADTASDDIYTLSGVKVNPADMTKGIYIKNGKKFIVK